MKKLTLSLLLTAFTYTQSTACAWYDPDYDYFNLFTQSIIRDKAYTPFLLTYSERFYSDESAIIPDENIEAWRKYFNNKLTYQETDHLVKHLSLNELQRFKKGESITDGLLQKLGSAFYSQYQEGFDYLIEAKYLEPYASIIHSGAYNSFYYDENANTKTAADLNYDSTIAALTQLYNAAKNPEIKLRYGYQLVRFNHYNQQYQKAVDDFNTFVAPLKLKTAPYYLALDQYAGALRGLQKDEEANWNFFQVFKNSASRKQSAYISMQLSDSISFDHLLKRAQSNDDKNLAYFLLGYQDFNNPLPMMEKMYEIDPNSEMLKVLAARAINELERNFLPTYYFKNAESNDAKAQKDSSNPTQNSENTASKETSFWDKVIQFFKKLFGIKDSSSKTERNNSLSDKDYLNNPDRIPFFNKGEYDDYSGEEPQKNYLNDLVKFTDKIKDDSKDEFWQIADAYLKFLQKDYAESSLILSKIKTTNPEYQKQITRMKMLNDIVSQPKITPEFENHLMKEYQNFFVQKDSATSKDAEDDVDWSYEAPSTEEFLRDVLANRYYLQGEDAKSFLLNNKLSDLKYSPNLELAKKLESFYRKTDKTEFEQKIIAANMDNVGNLDSYFAVIYGDDAMRNAEFEKAKQYYEKGSAFSGITVPDETWNYGTGETTQYPNKAIVYNGFNNISSLVFGHNIWESFQSPESKSMKAESFIKDFPFISTTMNKLQVAEALIQLKKIGNSNTEKASQANQLIGNLLYNTSILGYFRQLFVMDFDNANGPKFNFAQSESFNRYYYKNYYSNTFIKPDRFDLALSFYQKAMKTSKNREQQARILFQMASAEQGKFYQWQAKQPEVPYADQDWEAKMKAQDENETLVKNQKYRTYFTQLKKDYGDTNTANELRGNCSYFDYFMKK